MLLEVLDIESTAFAYEAITVAASAIGFTSATYGGQAPPCNRALVTAETAQMRYRYDGTDPTASEGHLLDTGNVLAVCGYQNISQFRAIRTGATSGVLKVTFEKGA